jgi:phage regulator Rha-like protein
MNETQRTGFSERLKTAADAKQALLAKLRPKPTVTAPDFQSSAVKRTAELEQVRQARVDAKAARKQAAEDAIEAARQSEEAIAAAALDSKRGERKERKALTKAEAKAKRDARYAARKAR